MKKNWIAFPVAALLLAGLALTAVLSCDTGGGGGGGGPVTVTYTNTTIDDETYTLKVKGDTYELLIDGVSISTGTAAKNGDVYTLTPNGGDGNQTFDVTVESRPPKIINIEGTIITDDGDELEPGTFVEVQPVAGVWTWATMDDSKPNPTKPRGQSVFAPGGASRITNAVENPESAGDYQPFIYAEANKPKDKDGNTIEGDVFNFTGVTKVSSSNRPASQGARFPLVGWEAVPDAATLELLKTAYGYSFWVRLNSATASNWAFLTAVETDFEPEEGFEYKHYFGNQPGDSGGTGPKNYTSGLAVGTWYKITVIMNSDGRNMDQDGWLYQYPPNPDPKGPFNQGAAKKIQWQIPLQHQVGAGVGARNGDPYDIINGEYNFNVDFYGLELF